MSALPEPAPQQFFGNAPTGTNVNLAPPQITPPGVSPQAAGYDRGVASGLIEKPSARLTPTDIAWTPASEQWAAQQDLKAAVERGVPIEQAGPMYPAAFSGRGAMTANQQASLTERKREFDERQKALSTTSTATITPLNERYDIAQVPGSKAWRLIDKKSGEAKTFTPAQAAGLLAKITAGEQTTGQPTALSGMKEQLTQIVESGVPGARANAKGKPVTDSSPQAKAARANALRKLHPDWSRQRILAEVNG